MVVNSHGNLGIHTVPGSSNVLDVSGNIKLGHSASSLIEINSKLNSDLNMNNNNINNVESLQVNTLNAEELNINGSAIIDVADLTVEELLVQNDAIIQGNIDVTGDLNVNGTSNFDGEVIFREAIRGVTSHDNSFVDFDNTDKIIIKRYDMIECGGENGTVNFVCRGNSDVIADSNGHLAEGFCFFAHKQGTPSDPDQSTDRLLMYITSQRGNVGIRGNLALGHAGYHTSTPSDYKLYVDGNINLTGDIYQNGSIMNSGYWESMNETDTDISFTETLMLMGTINSMALI